MEEMPENYDITAAKFIRLAGTIERVIYSSDENGFAICDFSVEEYTEGDGVAPDGSVEEVITVLGTLPMAAVGDSLVIYGRWGFSPKYGRQFRVEQYERTLPADTASIFRYLASRTIKGIGPKTARRIVDEFGVDSFDVIENHPEWLAEIKGISRKAAYQMSEDFKEKAGMRNTMLYFRSYFGPTLTVRIYKKWGASAVEIAKENPYRLCDEIDGIGFERADRIALEQGIEKNSEERICSGIRYLLQQNGLQNGHVCLPREKLLPLAVSLLEVDERSAEQAIERLLLEKRLISVQREGRDFLYESTVYREECYIAKKLVLLDRLSPSVDLADIELFIRREERENGLEYASLQRKAIREALLSGVMILTGGPGTGKTTVVRALLRIFKAAGMKVALAAPTGRAAKRLSEATSEEAKTIHRLLEMGGDRKGGYEEGDRISFHRDENNLLEEDAVIVDESSMIDNALMCALLKAVKPGARIVLIGDADQLPSVGAGNVLADLIRSQRFSTVALTEIFRQAEQSLIIRNAHAINRGEMPDLSVKDNDFFFLPRHSDREIAYTISDLSGKRLPRAYGEETRAGIQIISPSRKGEGGTEALNLLLQAEQNPQRQGKKEYHYRDTIFREGDKVMQIRNNYDIYWERPDSDGNGIFNGDIGIIERIDSTEQMLEIRFDDRLAQYDFSMLDELDHAYAITVHKSQGSEYPTVIIPAYHAPAVLLTRNLLYTAVTRAQTRVIIVGYSETVRRMVENNRQSMRYTGLAEALREEA